MSDNNKLMVKIYIVSGDVKKPIVIRTNAEQVEMPDGRSLAEYLEEDCVRKAGDTMTGPLVLAIEDDLLADNPKPVTVLTVRGTGCSFNDANGDYIRLVVDPNDYGSVGSLEHQIWFHNPFSTDSENLFAIFWKNTGAPEYRWRDGLGIINSRGQRDFFVFKNDKVLQDKVSKSGDETIFGIKSFAASLVGLAETIDIGKNPTRWTDKDWFLGRGAGSSKVLGLRSSRGVNGDEYSSLFAYNKDASGNDINASLSVVVPREKSPYGLAPTTPANVLGNEIVTAGHAKDIFINRLQSTTLYAGGANAADRDPRSGWGFSADKPFATFSYAKAVLMTHFVYNGLVSLVLQDDLTWDDLYPWLLCANIGLLSICSASASDIRTLTFNSTMNILSGQVQFSNIRLNYPKGSGAAIQVNGGYRGSAPTLLLGSGCVFSGACSVVVQSIYNGTVFVQGNLAGDISGQRYTCTGGSRIITNGRGPEAIPGTAAGYCDSTSIYS